MTHKYLLVPERVRRLPKQFSWLDQRLVREHYLPRCDAQAWALYLLLVTVSDARGLSYYSDRSLSDMLSFGAGELAQARKELMTADLLAYQAPLYQVLALPDHADTLKTPSRSKANRPLPLAELLKLKRTLS